MPSESGTKSLMPYFLVARLTSGCVSHPEATKVTQVFTSPWRPAWKYTQEVLQDSVADTQPCLKPWRGQSSTNVYKPKKTCMEVYTGSSLRCSNPEEAKVLQTFTSARRLAWKYTQEDLRDNVADVWLGFTPWRDQSYTSVYKHHETCTESIYTGSSLCPATSDTLKRPKLYKCL